MPRATIMIEDTENVNKRGDGSCEDGGASDRPSCVTVNNNLIVTVGGRT